MSSTLLGRLSLLPVCLLDRVLDRPAVLGPGHAHLLPLLLPRVRAHLQVVRRWGGQYGVALVKDDMTVLQDTQTSYSLS